MAKATRIGANKFKATKSAVSAKSKAITGKKISTNKKQVANKSIKNAKKQVVNSKKTPTKSQATDRAPQRPSPIVIPSKRSKPITSPPPVKAQKIASVAAKSASPTPKGKLSQGKAASHKQTPGKNIPAKASQAKLPTPKKTPIKTPVKATPQGLKSKPTPQPAVVAPVEEKKMVTAIRKGRAAVDVECPRAKDCHVFEEGNKVWTVTLNQADLKNNANKYYIIQLLQSDSSQNQYFVWNRWGRVGYAGQNALKGPFGDLNRAKVDYESKFRDKTRNGYIEVQIVYEEENEPKPVVETKKNAKDKGKDKGKETKSALDISVQNLINLIFDLKSINRTLAEIGYDSKKMPLGKLSTATIKQGLEVLKAIESALPSKNSNTLQDLSSKFYSLIPHDFGFQKMANFIINTQEKLKQKVEMLESLADMKIATNILEASVTGSPVDSHYQKLKCNLKPIDKKDPVYKILVDYITNTHGGTHNYYTLTVEDIFRLDKEGEKEKFNSKLHNHMLLWHGSRLTNWVGILSQGLRIAPPEAPVSGYMFGKGVYFADMVSKSANYCFTSKENNTGILMLCDVALGNFNELLHSDYRASDLPKNKHSTKGCGINAPPEKSYGYLEGCKVPLGPDEPVKLNGGYLQYNEYIVYNTNQIKMKFLFRVKFNYKY